MTTMIERAARAMYANIGPDWSWDDPDAEILRQMYRENVRVALAALRDPGEALGDATRWQAAIDAILAGA